MHSDQPKALKVYFEVTNTCNFKCDFCPIGESKRKRQHMDFSLFRKGIDDVLTGRVADTVGFHVLGEPLLYPKIFDALTYAKRKGLRTELTTNGSLLTEARVEKLVEARLDTLTVSLQMLDEREHECRGSGMSFGEYYERIMEAIRSIKKYNCAAEVVLVAMNTSTKKFFDVDKPMRMNWSGSTFREKLLPVCLDVYSALNGKVSGEKVEATLNRLGLYQPRRLRIDDQVVISVLPFADWGNAFTSRKVHSTRIGFCGYALRSVGILSNGEVTICCADYDGKTSLGNLHTNSLASLLSSEEAQVIREGFKRMRIAHPYCQRCLGSTSRLKAAFKGLVSIGLFRLLKFQPGGRVKEVPLLQA